MADFMTFQAAGKSFAVPLARTEKVVPLVALAGLPMAEPCVVGVMNLAGVGVPVVDLAIRLDLPEKTPYTLATSIVVCRVGDKPFGLIAERIDGVRQVAGEAVEMSDALRTETMPYLGFYQSGDDGPVLVLDLDRVLDLRIAVEAPPDDALAGAPDGAT
jgi:purine-binding chemotaxis protein CheW